MNIFFRSDGNQQIGYGHISRSIALAEMLEEAFECCFLLKKTDDLWIKKIKEKWEVQILPEKENIIDEVAWMCEIMLYDTVLVLDGYHFDSDYQKEIKRKSPKTLLISICDSNLFHFYSDMIINHAQFPIQEQYSCETYTEFLLGPEYAILRRLFLLQTLKEIQNKNNNEAFICFGGSDPYNLTAKAILACLKSDRVSKIFAVAGSIRNNKPEIEKIIMENNHAGKEVILEKQLSVSEILEQMNNAGITICPSSTLAYEACAVRSLLITGYYIDNQVGIFKTLQENECCFPAYDLSKTSVDDLADIINHADGEKIISNQKRIFDGKSGEKITQAIKKKCEYRF